MMFVALVAAGLVMEGRSRVAGDPLTVASDFEGASVRAVEIDAATRIAGVQSLIGGHLPVPSPPSSGGEG